LLSQMNEFIKKKKYGQNFLTSPDIPRKIAAACGADKQSGIIEIGPGKGILTVELAKIANKVCAVEIDTELKPYLNEIQLANRNIDIVYQDILKIDINEFIEKQLPNMNIYVCANLPYYITTPILIYLLESQANIDSITIMVQKEVAERLCSKPGTSTYSAITVAVNYHSEIKKLFNVPSGCFSPRPKVDSTVINLKILKNKAVAPKNETLMFGIIKSVFEQRRKTLVNNLYSFFNGKLNKEEITNVIVKLGFSTNTRGETLSINDFCIIADHFNGI